MSPWLLLPESAPGISLGDADLMYLRLETCGILWLIFITAIATLFVVFRMVFRSGPRARDVNEGSEMEKGRTMEAKEEEMMLRRRSSSMGVWRVE